MPDSCLVEHPTAATGLAAVVQEPGSDGTAYLDLPKGQGVESGWVVFVG